MRKIGSSPNLYGLTSRAGFLIAGSLQEDLFVKGKSFSFEDYFTFSASEVKTIVLDPTAFTGVNLTFNPVVLSATAGPILVDFYVGTIANADGTLLGASNRRPGFPSPQTILRLNPTGVTLGTRFAGDLVPSTGMNPATSVGAGNMPGLPFEFLNTIKYAVQFTNLNGADTYMQLKVTWFEV